MIRRVFLIQVKNPLLYEYFSGLKERIYTAPTSFLIFLFRAKKAIRIRANVCRILAAYLRWRAQMQFQIEN